MPRGRAAGRRGQYLLTAAKTLRIDSHRRLEIGPWGGSPRGEPSLGQISTGLRRARSPNSARNRSGPGHPSDAAHQPRTGMPDRSRDNRRKIGAQTFPAVGASEIVAEMIRPQPVRMADSRAAFACSIRWQKNAPRGRKATTPSSPCSGRWVCRYRRRGPASRPARGRSPGLSIWKVRAGRRRGSAVAEAHNRSPRATRLMASRKNLWPLATQLYAEICRRGLRDRVELAAHVPIDVIRSLDSTIVRASSETVVPPPLPRRRSDPGAAGDQDAAPRSADLHSALHRESSWSNEGETCKS